MQTRHRIPTIFNLSMVDVLCCALGCIILLWLVYFKEARERSLAAGQTGTQLAETKVKLENVLRDLLSTQQALIAVKQISEDLGGELKGVTSQRDAFLGKWELSDKEHQATLSNLNDAKTSIAGLNKDLLDLETKRAAASSTLAEKSKDNELLAAQLLAATQNLRTLEKLSGSQKDALDAAAKQAAELYAKLSDSEKSATKLEQQVSGFGNLSKEYQKKLTDAEQYAAKLEQQIAGFGVLAKDYAAHLGKLENKAALLQRELDQGKLELVSSNKRFDDLLKVKDLLEKGLAVAQGDLIVSEKQLDRLRAAAEHRFAGIELTGSRVLFLVDMSGSMRMKDNNTEDPDKWPLVCEILGKLMRSLPEMKQFQVILFSDKVRYPLANSGKWHDYHDASSIKNVVDAVRAETPQNATNMAAVMEEAFKYRALGLDTIYMLSDGLPNEGPGLPPNAAKLSDVEQSSFLAKYIRDKLKTTWNAPRGRLVNQRVRINTVGFYFDSPDVGAFLWALARDNNGSFVGLSKP